MDQDKEWMETHFCCMKRTRNWRFHRLVAGVKEDDSLWLDSTFRKPTSFPLSLGLPKRFLYKFFQTMSSALCASSITITIDNIIVINIANSVSLSVSFKREKKKKDLRMFHCLETRAVRDRSAGLRNVNMYMRISFDKTQSIEGYFVTNNQEEKRHNMAC